ncbi:unnamed protein product [Spirodela intermedia]|uniref:Uncharacterized protein n=1 Tax=Spirodela intermedia TaxID=51605 RepID=A0A7I8IRB6_SPIIN|nr:unnamed protein product [Spirodela intermedia]CAA6659491.1 unnamed protein product [Spirodela intermedia]
MYLNLIVLSFEIVKEIWDKFKVTYKGISHMKDTKIDILVAKTRPLQGQLPTIEEEEFKPKIVGNDDYIE